MAAGMTPEEARHAAMRLFGNATFLKEDTRRTWGWVWLEQFLQDLGHGVRVLRRNPLFTAVAVVTLALGIGATAAIFSVVDTVLLRSLPYRNPARLVSLYEDRTSTGFPRKEFTPANYLDCKAHTEIFEDLAAIDAGRFFNLTGNGAAPERLSGEGVTQNLFSILGVYPLLGRIFLPEEDTPAAGHVALLSHRLWVGRFARDPNIVGQAIILNGEKYSVVGVMPPRFSFPSKDADLWVPAGYGPEQLAVRGAHFLMVVGALRPGVSVERANAELRVLSQQLRHQYMDIMRFTDGFVAVPLQEVYTREVRGGLIVLLAAVAFILLIACANIANLLLSRANARQREISLRITLGATRGRIIRQLLTESALLGAAGGILGALLARGSFNFLRNLIPDDLARSVSLSLSLPVLAFTILISLASTFVFGLAPALQISKVEINDSLKEGGRGGPGSRRKTLGNLLVIGEIALALLLLIASSLLLQSFANLRGQDPGFRSEHVFTAHIDLPETKYRDFLRRAQCFQTVLDRVRILPGVTYAGFTSVLPLTWKSGMAAFLPKGELRPDVQYGALDRVVSPGYFEAMRIPLLRGRLFNDRDGPDSPGVAIVNESMARTFWPNQNALDKRFRFDLVGGGSRLFQIVGIVRDVKQMGLDEPPKSEMYFPFWQAQGNYMMPRDLAVRTTGDPRTLANAVRQAVWSVDPDLPVSGAMTMDDVLDLEVAQRRVQALLLGAFAVLALTLSCIGIYGVMAYLVAQQNHEIGVRAALGAGPLDILNLVLSRGIKLTAAGVSIGVAASLLLTRLIAGLLFGVSPFDPLTLTTVALLLSVVALAACYIPARRAMHADPMHALRCE